MCVCVRVCVCFYFVCARACVFVFEPAFSGCPRKHAHTHSRAYRNWTPEIEPADQEVGKYDGHHLYMHIYYRSTQPTA